jgi:hypothetical protein
LFTHQLEIDMNPCTIALADELTRMSLRGLADWVALNNNGLYDTGEFPAIDDLDDDDEAAAREEYEAMAEDILAAHALGPCGR